MFSHLVLNIAFFKDKNKPMTLDLRNTLQIGLAREDPNAMLNSKTLLTSHLPSCFVNVPHICRIH